jgi:hypothetical protein
MQRFSEPSTLRLMPRLKRIKYERLYLPDKGTAGDYPDLAGYPHLFRHQIITFLTRKGIIRPKLQLLSGHAEEKSLAIYWDLALADVSDEYEQAMRSFPVR